MRPCNQMNCTYLQIGFGCKNCIECNVNPFIVSGDCERCKSCESVPDCLRWDDDSNDNSIDEKEKNKIKEKPVEVKVK